jgi:SAM-dependent methyltransferase
MDSYISQKFGNEWSVYPEIIPSHRDQFLEWINPFRLEEFRGKSFLDAGCGIGRNSRWPLEAGASSGYAFDFDERTVQVARNNLKNFPQCEVHFKSIYDLGLRDRFDVVFCIGVIHHLERPREAIESLVAAAKPGGKIIVWVYAREGNRKFLWWFDPFRKLVSSHLPFVFNLWLARLFTLLLKAYLIIPRKNHYLGLLKARTFRHAEAMVLDQLIPSIAQYWTRDEVLKLVDVPGTSVESIVHTNNMSWTVILKKSA